MKTKAVCIIVICISILTLYSCKEDKKVFQLTNSVSADEISYKTTLTHFSDTIASNVNGALVFCGDIQDRVEYWEHLVNNNSTLNLSIDNVIIDFEDGIYYLTAKDARSKVIARLRLLMDGGILYERSFGDITSSQHGNSCSCTGCLSTGPDHAGECSPKQNNGEWYCTDCSSGECTKTETAVDGGFLSL